MKDALQNRVKAFPLTSGVYLMKNSDGKVIYVGKAVCLRKRVASYFRKSQNDFKTRHLVREIEDIDYLLTQSEAEALILEASLVKKYQPQYNVELRDDKSYPSIEITGDEFPRIQVVRLHKNISISTPRPPSSETGRRGVSYSPVRRMRGHHRRSQYFGPYVEPRLIREALTLIRKIFPFCTCAPFPKKPCLNYHLGLCNAPCAGKVTRGEYRRNIRQVAMILAGRKDDLYRELQSQMEHRARQKNFEAAAKVRDQMRAVGALYSGGTGMPNSNEAEQLARALSLPKLPERIEAFDISHIMGSQSVGSMVAFLNGRPDKNNYRRFRIKTVKGIDDFAMIAEVVSRRYRRVKDEGGTFPDLIVIDGGKGQLATAAQALEALAVSIPLLALAKREEEIFVLKKRNPIVLPKDSLGLQLLQRVRDEAHRFAIAYHKKLRSKAFFGQKNSQAKQ